MRRVRYALELAGVWAVSLVIVVGPVVLEAWVRAQ